MGDGITVQLAAGAHVYLRGHGALQFGLDATRAGIIETDHAPLILATLLGARRSRPRGELAAGLVAAGLTPAAADSLLEDLLVYRILVERTHPSVVMLGRGPLAQSVGRILAASGVAVRSPIKGESEYSYLTSMSSPVPVVVVDRLAHSRAMAPLLTRCTTTSIPVSVVDHLGVIGPVRVDAVGPCPLCADLHRTDHDAFWHRVVTQAPGGATAPSPVAAGMVAAQAGAVICALVGLPTPPGVSPWVPRPGEVITTDPWAGVSREVMDVHPRCPVCFSYSRNASSTASN
ncbi:MAG: hypothetical protein Q4G50_12630 [Corynebacterium sp.]|uniref:hypothetical protein n=1 Tax=Corynebacterium sp. TaxID=1720 RepID=UPI0026DEE6B9|nr:hypothetical protein [Corynebacterium sp.]MDO5670832.1 hypothetical protein [Corynebacterium sp.]